MSIWMKTSDGSIVDGSGKLLFFSTDRFVRDICEGECCFICGAQPGSVDFNNEHVLPRWLLKRFDLFDRQITLPNLSGYRYGQYTIPCCVSCNSLMGERIEKPVQQLIEQGIEAVAAHLQTHGGLLFFVWLSLVFFKTHLRDKKFRFYLDRRKGDQTMSDELYDWRELHHIHCVARSFYTEATITTEAFGSLFCLAAKTQDLYEHFDYGDLSGAQAILLRVGDVAFVSILNDSNAALSCFTRDFRKVDGALSPLQLREVMAHLAYINSKLKIRPEFATAFDGRDLECRIVAKRPPKIELEQYSRADFGEIFHACVHAIVSKLKQPNAPEMLEAIKGGRYSFLFDDNGKFIHESVVPGPPASAP